ncbi:EAL domain-containing protein [Oxalobacteraceae bacterium OM1]|nr:EAL domain-containing protein [Oxalobacteraceae bacterium OM1]
MFCIGAMDIRIPAVDLGAAPRVQFADLLHMASEICDMPIALVTARDEHGSHLVCSHGLGELRPLEFCKHALMQDGLMEVPDATRDPRFADLPEVTGAPHLRAYFGAPLVAPSGQRLGTLAFLDTKPRTLDGTQRRRIAALAHQVMVNFELHRQRAYLQALTEELSNANAALGEQAQHLKQAQQVAKMGSWQLSLDDQRLMLSDQILEIYGITREEFGGGLEDFMNMVYADDRRMVREAQMRAIREGAAQVQCRVVRGDGEVRVVEITGRLFCGALGRQYLTGTTQDITEKKAAEDRIRHLAYFDQLTGLPNRQAVLDRIDRIVHMRERMNDDSAVLFIDLDHFKTLNDTHGHDKGDLLLKEVAARLQRCVRPYDCVGRFGGDEFVVVFENIGNSAMDSGMHALHAAQKILGALNQPYRLGNLVHHCSPSIGIALLDGEILSTHDLLKRADMAMYRAKAEGRNDIRFFNPSMQQALAARAELEADLRGALAEKGLFLEYQPQVDRDGRIFGVEALLRWRHWRHGLVPPDRFLSVAEELGMGVDLGSWLLEETCEQLERWSRKPITSHLSISVNVTARQFHHPKFVSQVLDSLARRSADPARLNIEITESMLVQDFDTVREKINTLKEHGLRFSLDDFGTGYSSLAYLQQLPLDELKIDRSFVRDAAVDRNDATITRSIIGLAHNLGLDVIAEGVETEEQREFLLQEGCNHFQGFLYYLPQSADMVEQNLVTAV